MHLKIFSSTFRQIVHGRCVKEIKEDVLPQNNDVLSRMTLAWSMSERQDNSWLRGVIISIDGAYQHLLKLIPLAPFTNIG